MTAKAKADDSMPLWAKLMLAAMGLFGLLIFCGLALVAYLFWPRTVAEGQNNSPTGLVKVFPGDEADRLVWAGMLTQFGDAVERDGGNQLPTLISRDTLKSRWREAQRYRMDFRGEGRLWGAEYEQFAAEIQRRVDAVVDDGPLEASERTACRHVMRDAAEELAGSAWEEVQ